MSTSVDSPARLGALQSNDVTASLVDVHDHGNGVVTVRMSERASRNTLSRELVEPLTLVFDALRESAELKVVVLAATPAGFARGSPHDDAVAAFCRSIVSFPLPVIAAVEGDALGAGLVLAALCDFMVCGEEASFGYTDCEAGVLPTAVEDEIFRRRFGPVHAAALLYGGANPTGAELRTKRFGCPVVASARVEAHALELAAELASKPRTALRALKERLASQLAAAANAWSPCPTAASEPTAEDEVAAESSSLLHVEAAAERVLLVRVREWTPASTAEALAAELDALFGRIARTSAYRAIVLAGADDVALLPESSLSADATLELGRVLQRAPLPIVAQVGAAAEGNALLIAQWCDAAVYRDTGRYSAAGLIGAARLASLAAPAFSQRLGEEAARELLLTGGAYSGAELERCAGPLPIVPAERQLPEALRLAAVWAGWPLATVRTWKERTTGARVVEECTAGDATPPTSEVLATSAPAAATPAMPAPATAAPATSAPASILPLTTLAPASPAPLRLASSAVRAAAHPGGIVEVILEDRDSKNLFTEALVTGLDEAFTRIEACPEHKVIVLTGYDRYFASGGTKQALLAIQRGELKFTDDRTFCRTLTCKLPVIAAMQGHAVGAGLALGLFADLTLLAAEGKYFSPYMGYGFTPGAGATSIVPRRIGLDLARETLFTAREYDGAELASRGAPLPIRPRKQVRDAALELAGQLARHSRDELIRLKDHLTRTIRDDLPKTCERELAMHELTFVGQAETLREIETTFARGAEPEEATSRAQERAPAHDDAAAESLPDVIATLKALLAQELHLEEHELEENTQFNDLGLDSISGVTWIRKINQRYAIDLEATIVYAHPTLTKLGRHVKSQVDERGPQAGASALAAPAVADGAAPTLHASAPRDVPAIALDEVATGALDEVSTSALYEVPASAFGEVPASAFGDVAASVAARAAHPAPRPVRELQSWRARRSGAAALRVEWPGSRRPAQDVIAVIGMAGRFPRADNVEEFWQNLVDGRNCVGEVPPDRWSLDEHYREGAPVPGKTNCKYLAALDDHDRFDPLFFNISPVEARAMDPQQRLFLQTCWHSLEHAGYNPKSLAGSRCGVFVGCASNDYGLLSRETQLSAHGFTGSASSILAARIAYFLDLQGPCLAIDTACSSSLVALATACDSLSAGTADIAIAGGVYVGAGPSMHIMTAQAGMLSADGKCYSFDHRANGFAPGEAVGAVVLKRLADAERDGDIVHAVVRGWGVNQDGRTNGITAPNPDSQARLMRQVYDRYGIDPAEIQLIEAHGTGTALGDPIEVSALKKAFGAYTRNAGYCALGSVKSNIGHCLTAAGIAAFIKVVLALERETLPPTINFERLNEHIDLADSPFRVNDRLRPWTLEDGARRQAAVSSFGYSGTNAHVVAAQYLPTSRARRSAAPRPDTFIVPLSAKTGAQLEQQARSLAEFLREPARSIDLADLAYTLQVGREPMDERLGVLAGSVGELVEKLEATLAGRRDVAGTYRGQVRAHKEGISAIAEDDELRDTLVRGWIARKSYAKLLKLWTKGLELDWHELYGEAKPRRIVLPAYPFARERYWIVEPATGGVPRGEAAVPAAAPAVATPPAERLYFEERWLAQPAAAAESTAHARTTIVIGDAPSADEDLGDVLLADPHADVCAAIDAASRESGSPVSVVVTCARGRRGAGVDALFELFAAIRRSDRVADVVLVGRYDPTDFDSLWDYAWIGFERSLRLVLPDLRIALLYTDGARCTRAQVADARRCGGVVWYRGGQRFVLAATPAERPAAPAAAAIKQGGAYLITGGCGALGLKIARHLAERYRARLVLLGRSAPTAAIEVRLDELRRAGASEVRYAAVDVADRDALVAWRQTSAIRLSGVIHAAGVDAPRLFHDKTPAERAAVLRPKTAGTWLLDEVLADQPLDFVCYFSSSAAVLGDFGSCDYAIANRFQMGYAAYRREHGRRPGKTVVVNWPFWEKEPGQARGMGSDDPQQVAFYLKTSGQEALSATEGLAIWHDLLHADALQTLVLRGTRTRAQQFVARAYRAEAAAPAPRPSAGSAGSAGSAPLGAATLAERLRAELRQLVSSALQLEPSRLDDRTNLADYGFDSIGLASFAKDLASRFALEVTPALFFNHATVAQLAEHFAETHGAHFERLFAANDVSAEAAAQPRPPARPAADPPAADPSIAAARVSSALPVAPASGPREPIAVIGMSGRFPRASHVDELWRMLEEGRSGISEVPSSRWNWRDYVGSPGAAIATGHGGFIDGVDEFDPLFFEVSPAEAEEMDPAERLLLMEAYRAVEDAGISPASLRGANVGVFVGMEESQYGLIADQGVTTSGSAMVSSRLSYFLDLHGPTIAINTACSSGLVALHQAVQSLRSGECDSALVAGVGLSLSPKAWVKMSQAGMLSPDGRCHAFSKHATGIGIGEAVVVLMLKRLAAALDDGDRIYGVVKASGINFDGKTNGVTAPNGRMQAELIESVYTDHGIDIRSVSHIVAHGTGTKLGDPVELDALDAAFKKLEQRDPHAERRGTHCAITSAKANVGHTMAASGLVSVVGLLKGMEHRKIPASLLCEELNDYVAWRDSRFYVNKTTCEWRSDGGEPRVGAVSAFGRSGTNAHVVIEEPPADTLPSRAVADPGPAVVPLSARAAPQLAQKARDLLDYLRRGASVDLAALAYTLQVAREPMEERVAFVVDGTDRLAAQLEAYLAGEPLGEDAFQGRVSYGRRAASVAARDLEPAELARAWADGADVDWSGLYEAPAGRPRRLRLPTYPFARERYWAASGAGTAGVAAGAARDPRASDGLESIEDIIGRLDAGSMDRQEAVALLKTAL